MWLLGCTLFNILTFENCRLLNSFLTMKATLMLETMKTVAQWTSWSWYQIARSKHLNTWVWNALLQRLSRMLKFLILMKYLERLRNSSGFIDLAAMQDFRFSLPTNPKKTFFISFHLNNWKLHHSTFTNLGLTNSIENKVKLNKIEKVQNISFFYLN